MNRLLLLALVVFIGLGIGAGLMVVGGPGYARMERNDQTRFSDLRQLGNYYQCVDAEDVQDGISPRYCGGMQKIPDIADPVTGARYVHNSVDETHFEVCATFETDQHQSRTGGNTVLYFEGQIGCLRYVRADVDSAWIQK